MEQIRLCWKATTKWNIKVENILEKRRTKIEKMKIKFLKFCKIWSRIFQFFLIMKIKLL